MNWNWKKKETDLGVLSTLLLDFKYYSGESVIYSVEYYWN